MVEITADNKKQTAPDLGSVVIGLSGEVHIAATGLRYSAAARILGAPDTAPTAALDLVDIEDRLARAMSVLEPNLREARACSGDAARICALYGDVILGAELVKLSAGRQLSNGALMGAQQRRSLEDDEQVLRRVLDVLRGTAAK